LTLPGMCLTDSQVICLNFSRSFQDDTLTSLFPRLQRWLALTKPRLIRLGQTCILHFMRRYVFLFIRPFLHVPQEENFPSLPPLPVTQPRLFFFSDPERIKTFSLKISKHGFCSPDWKIFFQAGFPDSWDVESVAF